jgi:hypothetical protein
MNRRRFLSRALLGGTSAAGLLTSLGCVAQRRSPDDGDAALPTPTTVAVTRDAARPTSPTSEPAMPAPPTFTATPTPRPDVVVTLDRATVVGTSRLTVGVTHTQHSIPPAGDSAATERAKSLLRNGVRSQNQHIIGFGADDINPRPGVYDWASLDRRIDLARACGNEPIITLCTAPG